ncbi:MAG: heme-copper oxidase subunit III [Runella sp.]
MPKYPIEKETFLTKRREPFNFMLWLGMGGSMLTFLVVLLVYLSRKSVNIGWTDAPLPTLFWVSTAVIVVSSLTLHLANHAMRLDKFLQFRRYIWATLLLGILFVILQFLGWRQLIEQDVSMVNNPSIGFVYLISGLHLLHILGGIGALSWVSMQALRNSDYVDAFVFSVNPPNQLKMRLTTIYWHFVDILWLVLFGFLVWQ